MQAGHAVYQGEVGHLRLSPRQHGFSYNLAQYWLDCSMLDDKSLAAHGICCERFGALSYRRRDYLPGDTDLFRAVCARVAQLGGSVVPAKVFVLTPLANWGLYFSPLTLYYCYDEQGDFCYLLAEVSNTPWNERHYYLQTLSSEQQQYQHQKAFHVSPFMPLAMRYRWQIGIPGEQLQLRLANYQQEQQQFEAGLQLHYQPLNRTNLKRLLLRTPAMTLKIIAGIYWQALRLWWRGARFYPYSSRGNDGA